MITTIGSLIIALVSLITGYYLQKDAKKIRELERDNKKYKSRLLKALFAIKGYQLIEEDLSKNTGIHTAIYRKNIRKNKQEYFNSQFLTPANIEEMIQDLNN